MGANVRVAHVDFPFLFLTYDDIENFQNGRLAAEKFGYLSLV